MKPFEVGTNRPIFLPHKLYLEHATSHQVRQRALDHNALNLNFGIEGAERIAEMGFNWVFIPFSDGFPAQIERSGDATFVSAVTQFHRHNISVAGMISVSTAVATHDFAAKDWYAVDPDGNPIRQGVSRYFVQLQHPEWQTHIKTRIEALAATDVTAICLSVEGQGGFGLDLPMTAIGVIGSYDAETASAFVAETGEPHLPQIWNPARRNVKAYVAWRTKIVSLVVKDWVEFIRTNFPDKQIGLQIDDPMTVNLLLNRGISYRQLSPDVDWIIIRDRNWYQNVHATSESSRAFSQALHTVVHTAIFRRQIARSIAPSLPRSRDDVAHPVRHYSQMLFEALFIDAPIIMPGLTIGRQGQLSSILHKRYASLHSAMQSINEWQRAWAPRLEGRSNASPLAVYVDFSEDPAAWRVERSLVASILKILQMGGYPLRVVGSDDMWEGVQVLIVPTDSMLPDKHRMDQLKALGGKTILVSNISQQSQERAIWRWVPRRTVKFIPIPLRPSLRFFNRQLVRLVRWYHEVRMFRRFVQWFVNWSLIRRWLTLDQQPTSEMQHALLSEIPSDVPFVATSGDMLLMIWREQDGTLQYTLFNHESDEQQATLHIGNLQMATVFAPGTDQDPQPIAGSSFMVSVNIAKIIRVAASVKEG